MAQGRKLLTHAQWEKIAPLLAEPQEADAEADPGARIVKFWNAFCGF